MTLRLTIDEHAWRAHVDAVRAATEGLVPVIKGNGYGFGRATLARAAAGFADEVAVGTVHELADVRSVIGPGTSVIALTPAMHLPTDLPRESVPTVGSVAHVDALRRHGWTGQIAVKLESSMRRHGSSPAELLDVLRAVSAAGLQVRQFVLHLPLQSPTFDPAAAISQVECWLAHLEAGVPLSLSHLPTDTFARLVAEHPTHSFRLRAGTSLWHGDKSFLHLAADVLEMRDVIAGQPLGYRQVPAPASGRLVMVGAGSAHGVRPLDGGLSPFHHSRQRMALVEPPHMHTSMTLAVDGRSAPTVGEWVDVQHPLVHVAVDELVWQ